MSRFVYVAPSPARRAEILALLDATPSGLFIREINAALNCGVSAAKNYLGNMGQLGDVEYGPDCRGQYARWYLPKHRAIAAAAVVERMQAVRVARLRRRAEMARALNGGESWFEQMPVHRAVSAAECRPLRPRGPVSVFQLGAA